MNNTQYEKFNDKLYPLNFHNYLVTLSVYSHNLNEMSGTYIFVMFSVILREYRNNNSILILLYFGILYVNLELVFQIVMNVNQVNIQFRNCVFSLVECANT